MKLRKRTQLFIYGADELGRRGRKLPFNVLRRGAMEVMNYRIFRKLLARGIAIAAIILMIGYAFVLMYNRTGRFSVAIAGGNENFAITLCETKDFKTRSSRLVNNQQVEVNNICGAILPANINEIDGEHNGENYLAYTFYCKNVGSVACSLNYQLTFNNVTNHVDECARVRLYVDGEYTDYAKTRSDGQGPETHFCDKPFAGKYTVCYGYVNNVMVEDIAKFTVVIWVEGDDADCNDSVVNGRIKFDMTIEAKPVVRDGEEPQYTELEEESPVDEENSDSENE